MKKRSFYDKKFEKIKVFKLVLIANYIDAATGSRIEAWFGETENEYFYINLSIEKGETVVYGAIDEREMKAIAERERLFSQFGVLNVDYIVRKYKWDISECKKEDYSEYYYH